MTQHDLAQALGMPQSSIARIERGTVMPRTATLIALLEATGHQLAVEPIGPPADADAIHKRLRLSVPRRTMLALGKAAAKDRLTSPVHILRRLRRFGVPFVLIGELAEVAYGSPIRVGRAVEVCHAGTETALERLGTALKDLAATGTDAGQLNLVTETAAGDDYDILLRNAVRMYVDAGILVPVAALDDLIRIRRAGKTPDDRAAEATLRAIGLLQAPTDGSQRI
jgi:transcriptional regulator with XRE-family HTH domain